MNVFKIGEKTRLVFLIEPIASTWYNRDYE